MNGIFRKLKTNNPLSFNGIINVAVSNDCRFDSYPINILACPMAENMLCNLITIDLIEHRASIRGVWFKSDRYANQTFILKGSHNGKKWTRLTFSRNIKMIESALIYVSLKMKTSSYRYFRLEILDDQWPDGGYIDQLDFDGSVKYRPIIQTFREDHPDIMFALIYLMASWYGGVMALVPICGGVYAYYEAYEHYKFFMQKYGYLFAKLVFPYYVHILLVYCWILSFDPKLAI